ncbi:MAG: hypothetical protein IK020_01175 [Clostridiales bacterium]|nr:hypothetical protein [Clostridiales bacterium]
MKKNEQLYTVLLWLIAGSIIIMFVLSSITLKRHFDARKHEIGARYGIDGSFGRWNRQE